MFRQILAVTAVAFWLLSAYSKGSENPIFDEVTAQGVPLGNVVVRLPPPMLPDGLSAAQQQERLARFADANHPLSAMIRKSIVAPQVLELKDEPVSGAVRPRRVDLWFIAYGNIDKLSDEDFLRQQAQQESQETPQKSTDEGRVLSDADLQLRNLVPKPGERFVGARFALFDRVMLSGTLHAMLTRTDTSVTAAGIVDSRFDNDREFPNAWQQLLRDETGRTSLGQRRAYSGVGWYAKATKLVEPPGAALIEMHAVFDEPAGWFDGANLLRSKLPILVQDNVRKFRRRLAATAE